MLLFVHKVTGTSHFTSFEGVWVKQEEPGPHTLWLEALGLFVPLSMLALWYGNMGLAQRHIQIALFVVFLIANVVLFQPWEVRACRPADIVAPTLSSALLLLLLLLM
jgi:hypothetical protein